MRFFSLVLCIALSFFSSNVFAAKKKNASKEPLSDVQLHNIATQELHENPMARGKKIVPLSAPISKEEGLVSTAEVLKEDVTVILPDAEFELGLQKYRPEGVGHVSDNETYSLRLNEERMVLLGFRKWYFDQGLRANIPWRAGLSVGLGAANHATDVRAKSGVLHKDIQLKSLMGNIGPEAEIFLLQNKWIAVGGRVAIGRLYTVQSASAAILNRSENINYWDSTAYLRVQPLRAAFAKLSFTRRNLLGVSPGFLTQKNNISLAVGYAL